MAPKPVSSEKQVPAGTDDPAAPELRKKLAADTDAARRAIGDKPAASLPSDDEDKDDDEALDLDEDEKDEDLVVFTAKEAAGALATIYAFVKPYLKNYKKILMFVGLGVVVETLFNVFMPLSLKFLIDDALGEEDFQALYVILGVLAAAGIFTSIVAVWYERWDARLAASSLPTCGLVCSSTCRICRRAILRGPSAAKFCRVFPSTFRPSRDRSRVLPTAPPCRSWN